MGDSEQRVNRIEDSVPGNLNLIYVLGFARSGTKYAQRIDAGAKAKWRPARGSNAPLLSKSEYSLKRNTS